ncbi:hypothetical protein JCM10450v2_001297 [Rhodotorula kratochvilovae]
MPRPTRTTVAKPVSYAEEPLSDDDPALIDEDDGDENSDGSEGHAEADSGDEHIAWRGDDDDLKPPPAKRARTSATAPKGKGKEKAAPRRRMGRLEAFQDMPMDVLFEIANHLDPLSLLQLGRANKSFRRIFASRSAEPLWQIVLSHASFPRIRCDDLNVLQLMSLLFEKRCRFCGRGGAVLVNYELRYRWCSDCRHANLLSEHKANKEFSMAYTPLQYLPSTLEFLTKYNSRGTRYYCRTELVLVIGELKRLAARGYEGSAELRSYMKTRAAFKPNRGVKPVGLPSRDAYERSGTLRSTGRLCKAVSRTKQTARITDTIWRRIGPGYIADVEETRDIRLGTERFERLKARRSAVKPFFDALLAAPDGPDRDLPPSFEEFSRFASVEPLWVPENSQDGGDLPMTWADALPLIAHDLAAAMRVNKVSHARKLLTELSAAHFPVLPGLVDKLKPAEAPSPPEASLLDGISMEHWDYEFGLQIRQNRIDLEDTADTVADDEFDALFAPLTSGFRCVGCCTSNLGYEDLGRHAKTEQRRYAFVPRPSAVVQQLLDVLELTGLPNERGSVAALAGFSAVL